MTAYLGSGPYCYASSLAMMLGESSPPPRVLEVLTGAPFGFALFEGTLPFFDPYGWSPEIGLDAAIDLLGWTCHRSDGRDAGEARARLTAALAEGPVLAGPLDMSLLLHQPGTPADYVADHYVVVLAIRDGTVVLHDPHGHPYATLPVGAFLDAWRGAGVSYLDSGYRLRTGFSVRDKVSESEALRRSLPSAIRWLTGRADLAVPPGTLGGVAAVERLAEQVEAGLPDEIHDHLVHFAIRLGARRLADAATCLASLGLDAAAAVATGQARLAGALQYPMVTGDFAAAATILRQLAPGYERLAEALRAGSS
ncbi:hypothetical protein [Amycolatopsis samaneae]|uniref:Uncharacterized protein n=1 Tax=Amycolatopsis samaneae TaxID=664691 RepID=A0ABW5GNJ2_9PSEU